MLRYRVSRRVSRASKLFTLVVCFVIMFSMEVTPLQAQLNAARNLTGTWQSSIAGTYYEMDPSDSSTRMDDVTATFTLVINQQGNQIDIILTSNPSQWTTDQAYWNEYGMNGVPPAGGMSIEFQGTVSSSSFTADEVGSQLTQEQLTGTFTTDIITATLSGTSETTDQNGIIVRLTSSGATPTAGPTSTGLADRYFGNIASIKGQAWIKGSSGNTPLSTGKIVSGTEIQTGSNGIIGFEPPNTGGTVYLGANSDGGWVGLTSQPAPDNGIQYMIYPQVESGVIFPNGNEQLKELRYTVPLDVAIAVLVFSEPVGQAAAVGLIIEGGAFLIPNGIAYVKETISHLLVVPQGGVIGGGTEYTVSVAADGTTTVQVMAGPVYFLDPASNNTVTVESNQELTLPPAQSAGFTQTQLQSYVSAWDSSSMNQWWNQAASSGSSSSGFLSLSQIIGVVAIVTVIVVAAVVASVARKKTGTKQPADAVRVASPPPSAPSQNNTPTPQTKTAEMPTPPLQQPKIKFCPNCGKQLPQSKKFCPFCGFNLNMQENKQE